MGSGAQGCSPQPASDSLHVGEGAALRRAERDRAAAPSETRRASAILHKASAKHYESPPAPHRHPRSTATGGVYVTFTRSGFEAHSQTS